MVRSLRLKPVPAEFWVETTEALRTGRITAIQPNPRGSNYTFFVRVSVDSRPPILAVYKPQAGEVPLWDFPDGTLYRREYAAYLVSQALNWRFVPPTVIRDGPHGVGIVQLFIQPAGTYLNLRGDPRYLPVLERVALFDLITNNADRKAHHCLLDAEGRVWSIDHGLTFNPVFKLRTVLWEFVDRPISRRLLRDVATLLPEHPVGAKLADDLRQLLDPTEIEVFHRRVRHVLKTGRFPRLDPYRNVPFGWW